MTVIVSPFWAKRIPLFEIESTALSVVGNVAVSKVPKFIDPDSYKVSTSVSPVRVFRRMTVTDSWKSTSRFAFVSMTEMPEIVVATVKVDGIRESTVVDAGRTPLESARSVSVASSGSV